jgi:hypothetical protein
MAALAGLFEQVRVLVPVARSGPEAGEIPLTAPGLCVVPLPPLAGAGWRRKLLVPLWLLVTLPSLVRELWRAEAVHAPIPGDVGTVGMLLAWCLGKPLVVRYCGNWSKPVTIAERFWRWFMERFAGGRNVMLATGGAAELPSRRNANVKWIFSTSLTAAEMRACARMRHAPKPGAVRLAHVARQEPAKGGGTAIRAVAHLVNDYPAISLDIIGDGSAVPAFRQLAHELGIGSRVAFRGKLDHEGVLARLREADLFCFSTTSSDGFPKAVLEALAAGVPVLATKVSVLPDLLSRGGGLLLEDATPEALVRGVRCCLENPEAYRTMSRRAVESAGLHTLEAWAEEIRNHCETAWGRKLAQTRAASPRQVDGESSVPTTHEVAL